MIMHISQEETAMQAVLYLRAALTKPTKHDPFEQLGDDNLIAIKQLAESFKYATASAEKHRNNMHDSNTHPRVTE
eukprot:3662539-Ditylum_brightwellii.AAC.1